MREKIVRYLEKLEKEREIKILLACETGSRAWGFPSPDSDYDVRIIYQHKLDWYINLTEYKDDIVLFLDNNEIDISGWEIRKSLRLLGKSNASLLERIQSPIIYKADTDFLKGINDFGQLCYSRIATIHHYMSLSLNCLADVEGKESYKLKGMFYALRASVACLWIMERNEIPPIEFHKMLDGLQIEQAIRNRIEELIKLKSIKNESYQHRGEEGIIRFIQNNLEKAKETAQSLPGGKGKLEDLNHFFKQLILQ